MYDWVNQTQITPDSRRAAITIMGGSLVHHPSDNQPFSEGQMTALRAQVTTLATSTKMVATTSDDGTTADRLLAVLVMRSTCGRRKGSGCC